ncbi:MAG: type II secretion system F family protein [Eubacteriales bacterium]|jgi:tight adherence protein B
MSQTTAAEAKYILSPLNNRMLNYRVYYMNATEKIGSFLLTLILGGLSGLVFYGGLFKADGEATLATHISNAVVFFGVGLLAARLFVPVIRNALKKKRDKTLRKQFMDFLESLSMSLAAGNTVNDAFINAKKDMLNQYAENDMIVRELSEILLGLGNGKTLEEMISAFGTRSGNEDIENFSNVMANCYRLGGDFKNVVRRTRDIIRDKIAIADEIETKLASNKLQYNAMCIMPLVLVAMLKVSSSDFAVNLASGVGVVVTTIAIGIFVGAYFWGKNILNIR